MPVDERRPRIAATLERFQLEGIASRRADRLSMGQRQRVRLALAFLHGPALVVLDEPWNSLDERGSRSSTNAVRAFAAGGGSGLFCVPTGHDLELVPADRTYVLERRKARADMRAVRSLRRARRAS